MAHSRWGSRGSGYWYTYRCIQDEATENVDTSLFDICTTATFTAKELRDDLTRCMLEVSKLEPEGDINELIIYVKEFLKNVDEEYN